MAMSRSLTDSYEADFNQPWRSRGLCSPSAQCVNGSPEMEKLFLRPTLVVSYITH